MNFIAALNALNQPWIAMLVILLGMTFDVICQKYGISNDAATGIIGAGIGLLTGQALSKTAPPGIAQSTTTTTSTIPPPVAPTPSKPAEPAQPKQGA